MMRRTMVGAIWGMILFLVGYSIVEAIVGGPTAETWRPSIALVAATIAAAGCWKGWLPGAWSSKDSNENR